MPDPWEAQALRLLAAGKKEVYQPVEVHGQRYLRLAHEIQRRFYRTTASVPGFDITGATVSAAYTGGDYFDFTGRD